MLQKKDTKIIFGTTGSFMVARLIFNFPHKVFHIRELSKETGLSTTSVIDGINILAKYKIVKLEDTLVKKNVQADMDSEAYRHYKIIFNLYRVIIYDVIERLINFFHNPECISLFGSFSKGEDIEESDIDILVISSYNKKGKEFNKFITTISKEFNRKINIHILPSLDKSDNSFKNTVANGIILHGYLKVI